MTAQDTKRRLLDHWIWEPQACKPFVAISVGIPAIVSLVLIPFLGPMAYIGFLFAIIGPCVAFGYSFVGKKIARILKTIPSEAGTAMQGLIVRGIIEAPGVIVLGQETLAFHPIMGESSEIMKNEIKDVMEVTFFNGNPLIQKTGFWFTVPGHKRLACAVPNSCADELRRWLDAD